MTMPMQRDLSLDDVLAFNDALMAYAATGLPVEWAAGDSNESLQRRLPRINARVALKVSRGESLADLLKSDPEITPRYRAALASWFRGHQPIEALDALATTAQGRRDLEATARASMVQPLIVLGLVYVGFILLLLNVAPRLEAMYEQLRQAPGTGLSVLLAARGWLPIWGIAVPLLIVFVIALSRWRPGLLAWKGSPGRTRYLDALHKANYADSVAGLLENNYSLRQALALLGPLPTESDRARGYAAATSRLIEAEARDELVSWDDPTLNALPALLRWAFTGDLLGQSRSEVLRITARNYRAIAGRYSARARWWMPTIVGALLGGIFVLAFGVSLFWPMIELLTTLTRPH